MSAFLLLVALADAAPAPARVYERALRSWTRELKLYDGWYTALLLRATYQAPAFVRARVSRWAELTASDPAVADARLRTALADAAREHTVRFTAASRWKDDLAFGGEPDAPWVVRFSTAAGPCAPVDVARVREPDAMDAALFPYTSSWDTVWVARFSAKTCGTEGPFVLEVAGAHGRGRLSWDVR